MANSHIQVEKDDYDYYEIVKIIVSKITTTSLQIQNTYKFDELCLCSANLQVGEHSPSTVALLILLP